MSITKFFNFCSKNNLTYQNLLSTSHIYKYEEQQAKISNKQRLEFGLPLPPKKPLSGFLQFAQSYRPKLLETQPHLSQQQIMKTIANKWHNLVSEEKLSFQNQSTTLAKAYCLEYQKYKQSLTPEQQEIIKQLKDDFQKKKQATRIKQKCAELNKPKKPASAFLKFWLDKINKKDKNIKQKEWIKLMAEEWMNNTSNSVKEQYKEEYLSELKKYKSDITAWEEKMIREQHTDIIHPTKLLHDKVEKKRV